MAGIRHAARNVLSRKERLDVRLPTVHPSGRPPWRSVRLPAWHSLVLCALCASALLSISPARASDDFIAGYASAILEHEFSVTDAVVDVEGGLVTVTTKSLGRADRGKVVNAIKQIPGVNEVQIRQAAPDSQPPAANGVRTTIPEPQSRWLPRGLLFSPLHADPRWAHFGASYRHFTQGLGLDHVFAANFGETFSIYRDRAPFGGQWDFGIQAGVFSIFDISSASIDLVNADYRVGVLTSYRNGRFSGFVRVQHQSSHLGDEYLLNNLSQPRINLSYEELDLKLSYEVFSWLRVYGGGGVIFHRYPNDLGVGTTQWGVELTSARTYLGGRLRPVAYADFQCNERTNWAINRSLLAGVQFENARIGDRQMQLLLEYYAGPSPDGQFYTQQAEWFGIGLRLYF
jgi:hypothetical protein